MLDVEVLTVRLPMSPDAAKEKLVVEAFAGGTTALRTCGKERIDRISSMKAIPVLLFKRE